MSPGCLCNYLDLQCWLQPFCQVGRTPFIWGRQKVLCLPSSFSICPSSRITAYHCFRFLSINLVPRGPNQNSLSLSVYYGDHLSFYISFLKSSVKGNGFQPGISILFCNATSILLLVPFLPSTLLPSCRIYSITLSSLLLLLFIFRVILFT